MEAIYIDPDIRKAETLPAAFYRELGWFERTISAVWEKAWLYAGDLGEHVQPGTTTPLMLLPGVLDEPIVLATDSEGELRCLSNVCTHRGKLVVEGPAAGQRLLRCGYHGRCFRLDGRFRSMPGFEETMDFPRPVDDLKIYPLEGFFPLRFTSLNPFVPFADLVQPMLDRISFLPLDTLQFDPTSSRDFEVRAHWALYVDNYLEGFHIPFVHPTLNGAIAYDQYEYHRFTWGNLQTGIAAGDEPCFHCPPGHPDTGKKIYAYYFWLFPNLMFNFYPWGLSLNVVEPINPERTRVRFRSYSFAGTVFDRTVNALEQTEFEDEAVVESVMQGIRSRAYHRGRFSVSMEANLHHFHSLLAGALNQGPI